MSEENEIKWTKQQEEAINATGNTLVSAAAGSGKTAVLTERVINLLTDENNAVDIDSMLIVTFTKKAAAEMKSKIAKRLSQEGMEDQLMRLPSAQICTIDSFCLDLVKENYNKVYIDGSAISSDFTIMDPKEEEALKNSTLKKIINYYISDGDSDFLTLYDMFTTEKKQQKLTNLIENLHEYIYVQIDPYGWLENAIECYNPDIPIEDNIWYKRLQNKCAKLAKPAKDSVDRMVSLLDSKNETVKGYETLLQVQERLERLVCKLDNTPEAEVNDIELLPTVLTKEIATNQSHYSSPETQGKLKEYNKEYKANIKAPKDKNFLSELSIISSGEYEHQMKILYPALKKLEDVIKNYDNELMQQKIKRNRFSYNDVLHFALNLLTEGNNGNIIPSKIVNNLKNSYSAIMVDEYQDTNRVQDAVFSLLSKDNLFMVGDVKQSIYRFRLAVPDIFIEKMGKKKGKKNNLYLSHGKIDAKMPSQKPLSSNFRSNEGICNYVNFVFSNFMSETIGEIDYSAEEYLEHGRDEGDKTTASSELGCAPVKLGIIEGATSANEAKEKEAKQIAQMIKSRVKHKEQIKDGNSYRDIRYSDFAILFRKAAGKIDIYADALEKAGIPYSYNINDNLFDYGEIELIISLLRIINNPTSDVDLLNVMLSPLYSFSPDDIAKISLGNSDENGENIEDENEGDDATEDSAKEKNKNKFSSFQVAVSMSKEKNVKAFLKEIEDLRKYSYTMPMAKFVQYLCEYKSIYAYSGALSNTEQRYENINSFIGIAESFDESGETGLAAFLNFIDNIGDYDIELHGAGDEDTVILTTVHKSKGLEYPIVVYADAEGQISRAGKDDSVFFLDQDMGIGIRYYDPKERYRRNTIQYELVKNGNKDAEKSEAMRVLYVAITRAREQFISFIAIPENNKRSYGVKGTVKKLCGNIIDGAVSPDACAEMKCDADYLLTAAIMHGDKGSDGKTLCEHYELNQPECPSSETFKFDVDIEYIGEYTEESESAATGETAATEAPAEPQPEEPKQACTSDPETRKAIAAKIETPCFDPSLTALPAKCNASELKKIKSVNPDPNNQEDPRVDKNLNSEFYGNMNAKPSFIPEKSTNKKGSGSKASSSEEATDASATERGTAMHDFMQFCSPEFMRAHHDDVKTADIEKEIERMVDAGQITARQAKLLNKEQLVAFTKSELAGRMFSVSEDKLYREKRVMSFMPASEAYGIASEEKVLVQGIADCVFEEEGKLILVDYKTDTFNHKTDNPSGREKAKEDLKNHYRDQVNFYRQALKKALGKEVSKAYLYSFVLGEEISVEE